MQHTPILPIGIDNFYELIKHRNSEGSKYLIVDKTLFIKDIIDTSDKITVITRPRRFGKSLNMSMLEHFFASEVDRIATKGLFDGLKISKFPDIMSYQGQFPVIFISLKEIRGRNFEEAYNMVKDTFRQLCEKHEYLLESTEITDNDKSLINKFIKQEATLTEYKTSLKTLSHILYKHHNRKKVVILIDEYDTPLHDAFCNNYYEEMRVLIAAMFNSGFKGNDYIYKGLVTGILKIAKSSLLSEFNNPGIYTMLSDTRKFANCFGFTEEELSDLLERSGLPKDIPELKKMYNGYKIHDYILYNPFSIIKFIDNMVNSDFNVKASLKPFWVNSGGVQIIKKLAAYNIDILQKDLTNLFDKKPIICYIDEDIIFGNTLVRSREAFWSILLVSGNLKIIKVIKENVGGHECELAFPNEEVRFNMQKIFLDVITSSNITEYVHAMRNLADGDVEPFIIFLSSYIKDTPSYYDEDGRFREQFYHGMLLGMSACLAETHIVNSNRESGKGRYDIALEPKDKSKLGIIIELKSPEREFDLKKEAKSALEQIKKLEYENEMKKRGIRQFIHIGIAFRKKGIAIEYK